MFSNSIHVHEYAAMRIKEFISRTAAKRVNTREKIAVGDLEHKSGVSSGSTMTPGESKAEVLNQIVPHDIVRICSGKENRTTLMVKKVPRRYTLEGLIREIDDVVGGSSSKKCYDLVYLPVDSAKMTNRGYAFINFTSMLYVEEFVREFLNRPWSDKNKKNKAAVLYWAYVQGREGTLLHIKTEVAAAGKSHR